MRVDPAAWPFVLGALAVAVVAALVLGPVVGTVALVLPVSMLLFFRDPVRRVAAQPGTVVSPADGRVIVAGQSTSKDFEGSAWLQVSIFLSPLDVHVNRIPIGGRVVRIKYHAGRFLPAYRAHSGDLNEYTEVWLNVDGTTIVVRQVVGMLARRIVCRTRKGAVVLTGERFGIMKFGSRMDVFLPASAALEVKQGQRVVGGVTRLGTLRASTAITDLPT